MLHGPCAGRVWPTVSCPDQRATDIALRSKVWTFLSIVGRFTLKGGLRCVSSGCCSNGGRYANTTGAALRPGTAVVVKISAGLDVAAVSPRGSVVTPGSASLKPPSIECTHTRSGLAWLQLRCKCLRVQAAGRRMFHTDDTRPCSSDYQVVGAR